MHDIRNIAIDHLKLLSRSTFVYTKQCSRDSRFYIRTFLSRQHFQFQQHSELILVTRINPGGILLHKQCFIMLIIEQSIWFCIYSRPHIRNDNAADFPAISSARRMVSMATGCHNRRTLVTQSRPPAIRHRAYSKNNRNPPEQTPSVARTWTGVSRRGRPESAARRA